MLFHSVTEWLWCLIMRNESVIFEVTMARACLASTKQLCSSSSWCEHYFDTHPGLLVNSPTTDLMCLDRPTLHVSRAGWAQIALQHTWGISMNTLSPFLQPWNKTKIKTWIDSQTGSEIIRCSTIQHEVRLQGVRHDLLWCLYYGTALWWLINCRMVI